MKPNGAALICEPTNLKHKPHSSHLDALMDWGGGGCALTPPNEGPPWPIGRLQGIDSKTIFFWFGSQVSLSGCVAIIEVFFLEGGIMARPFF